MQFNLVNDPEQVAQFARLDVAWRGVALCCIALALGFIARGGVPAALVAWAFINPWGAFPGCFQAVLAVSGSFAYYARVCAWPRGFGLANVWWRSCAF